MKDYYDDAHKELQIEDHYFDEIGRSLPIDPRIIDALKYYNFTDQTMVSYAHVTGGAKEFIRFAVKYRIPGMALLSKVERRYLQLYLELRSEQQQANSNESHPQSKKVKKNKTKNKANSDVATSFNSSQKSSMITKINTAKKSSVTASKTDNKTDNTNSKDIETEKIIDHNSNSNIKTNSNDSTVDDEVSASAVSDVQADPFAPDSHNMTKSKVSVKNESKISENSGNNDRKTVASITATSSENDAEQNMSSDDVTAIRKKATANINKMNHAEKDSHNQTSSESQLIPEKIDMALNSDKFRAKFNMDQLFTKLPQVQNVGPVKFNRRLANQKKLRSYINLSADMPEMISDLLAKLIKNPLAGELIAQLSYADLIESYTMYSTAAMGLMNTLYFQQWALGKALQIVYPVKHGNRVFQRQQRLFAKFKTVQSAIYDDHKETKLLDVVRWYLLLSTIEPVPSTHGTNDWLSQKFANISDRMDIITALGISSLSLEDSSSWPNILLGEDAKAFRNLVNKYEDDLVKPLQTMRRTKINKNKFKKYK